MGHAVQVFACCGLLFKERARAERKEVRKLRNPLLNFSHDTSEREFSMSAALEDKVAHVEVPRRVLIVEDDEMAAQDLEGLLSREPGLEATAVTDPLVAWRRLEQEPFSVVITDLRMPEMDGFEFIRRIQERRLPVTVIVMTAYGGVDEEVQAIRLGEYDVVTHPDE